MEEKRRECTERQEIHVRKCFPKLEHRQMKKKKGMGKEAKMARGLLWLAHREQE